MRAFRVVGDPDGPFWCMTPKWCGWWASAEGQGSYLSPDWGVCALSLSAEELQRYTGGVPVSRVIFSEEQIEARVKALGAEIAAAYPGGDLLLIALLKGSFLFLADLCRAIPRPLQVDFMVASSYGKGTTSSGNVRLLYDPAIDISGKHVVLVEDIIDTGLTLERLTELLQSRNSRSLAICTLLDKQLAARPPKELKFTGFIAPSAFLVGYGLDHAEQHRHLPCIVDMA